MCIRDSYLTDERIEAVLDSAYGYASEADYAGCAAVAVDRIASYMDDGVPAGQYLSLIHI